MVETVNYQCPACGGPLHFSGETGGLVCDYCDSTFTVKQVEDLYAAKQEKAEGKAEKEKRRAQKAEGGGANGAGDATAEAAAAGAAGAAGVAAGAASVSDNVVAAGAAQAAKAAEEGLDPIQAYLKRSNWNDAESETLATSVCSSCGAELIHDAGDRADSIAHLADTFAQSLKKIRVEGITEAVDRIAQRTGLVA